MTSCRILNFASLTFTLIFWALPVWAGTIAIDVWVRTYNGPGNSHDAACAVAVDDSGNIYVTGQSMGDGTDWDYATIKYHPNGDTAWIKRYDGPVSGPDIPLAMEIDGSGKVYVTGYSRGSGGNSDYLTIKYFSNGDTAWVRRYNGLIDSTDVAYGIAVDDSGNVYVTGDSPGVGTSCDYTTLKYNAEGDEVWVARYNGPGNNIDKAYTIAVDEEGNVYVTGKSHGGMSSNDFATVKYDPDGNEVWAKRYDDPDGGNDIANAMTLDDSANVYVTGLCYDSEVITKYLTVKYDSTGTELWVRTYKNDLTIPPGGNALAIAGDNSSNVWVTGWMRHSGTLFDYTTVKYDSDGNHLWDAPYHSWSDGCDGAEAIVADNSGNTYVTGWSDDLSLIADDYATVKYDPDGNQEWVARYNGTANSQDVAYAVTIDDSGNVYVTGKATNTESGYDYVTIKYIQIEGTRGDANGDGEVTISDAVYLINYLFKDGPAPDPIQAGDANSDDEIGIVDAVYLVNYLFKNGPPP